jgi:hypothetical protein
MVAKRSTHEIQKGPLTMERGRYRDLIEYVLKEMDAVARP